MSGYYIPPLKPDEIYHYGMPERSGRYAWGSGDRPYQRLEGKVSKMEKKLSGRFAKVDRRTSRNQQIADKKYERAIAKNNRLLATKTGKRRSLNRAARAQRKVNRDEYKMLKTFERYSKKFEKLNVTMDDDLKAKGLDYYNRVTNNPKFWLEGVYKGRRY